MPKTWQNVKATCKECGVSVGKITLNNGKIIVDHYNEHWGTWVRIPGKAEMNVLCRNCQRKLDKQRKKESEE